MIRERKTSRRRRYRRVPTTYTPSGPGKVRLRASAAPDGDDHLQGTRNVRVTPACARDQVDIGNATEIIRSPVEQLQKVFLERRADHRPAAEAHDGHARRHAAAIGKPANQRADRRDITQSQSATADHAVAQVQQPQLVRRIPAAPTRNHRPSRRPLPRPPFADRRVPATCRRTPPTAPETQSPR